MQPAVATVIGNKVDFKLKLEETNKANEYW